MENHLKELLRVPNTLCGKVFGLCRNDVNEENRQLASLVTKLIKDTLRLFEHKQ